MVGNEGYSACMLNSSLYFCGCFRHVGQHAAGDRRHEQVLVAPRSGPGGGVVTRHQVHGAARLGLDDLQPRGRAGTPQGGEQLLQLLDKQLSQARLQMCGMYVTSLFYGPFPSLWRQFSLLCRFLFLQTSLWLAQ